MKPKKKQKSKQKFLVGVIGCGVIFPRHMEAIKGNAPDFELAALCDIDKKRVDIFAQEYGVPGFTDYKDMLRTMKKKMNMVVIATPNALHYEQAIASLKSGYHILVEKPIDFKASRVAQIHKVAKEKRRRAFSVLQVRYNPTVSLLRKALAQNMLGDIRAVSLIQRWQRPHQYFESWRADINIGGRTLYEVGIHYMDIVCQLFGVPKILGSGTFSNKHKHVKFEDTVYSILQFPGGASGSLEVTIAVEPQNLECSLAIMGSEGYVKISGRALDTVERAQFSSNILEDKWKKIAAELDDSLQPNAYGLYAGSCPNHPTLYKEIAAGRGIDISESIPVVKFIESVYDKEAK